VIYVFYTVVGSEMYTGVAQILSEPEMDKTFNYWWEDGKWQGLMNVKWHFIKDMPYKHFKHIEEGDKPVTALRDGNKISFENGIKMLNIFKSGPDYGNIFDAFEYMDDREEKLRLTRDMTQNIFKNLAANQEAMGGGQSNQNSANNNANTNKTDFAKKGYNNHSRGYDNNYKPRGARGGYNNNNNKGYQNNRNSSNYQIKVSDNLPSQGQGSQNNQYNRNSNNNNYSNRGSNRGGDSNYHQKRNLDYNNNNQSNNNNSNQNRDNEQTAVHMDIQIKKKTKQSSIKKNKGASQYERKCSGNDEEYVMKKEDEGDNSKVEGKTTTN